MMKSLNFKIVRLIGGLLLFTAIAIMVAVWGTLNRHAQNQVLENIERGQKILRQLVLDREQQLANSAQVLAADFGFKQAVAIGDVGTIESVLTNHGKRINANLMMLFSMQNELVAYSDSHSSQQPASINIPHIRSLSNGDSIIFDLEGRFFQCILVEVRAPLPVAKALIGFELDQSFVNNLKAITNLEVTLINGSALNEENNIEKINYAVSTLEQGQVQLEKLIANQQLVKDSLFFINANEYVTRYLLLDGKDKNKIWIALSENVQQLFMGFQLLQVNIGLISVAALMLTLLVAAIFSKSLSKPLSNFVETTQKIAKGDYHYEISQENNIKEVNQLSRAIESMRSQISERQKEIEFRATHDHLTKLINRYEAEKMIDSLLAEGTSKVMMLVGFKLKNLKSINLAFGHIVGDTYLESIAERLSKLSGIVAYLGAAEFLWITDDFMSVKQLNKVKKELEDTYDLLGTKIEAKMAAGVFQCDSQSESESGRSHIRKLSLAVAASDLRNGEIQYYNEQMEKEFKWRIEVLHQLERALDEVNEELTVNYQPKIHATDQSSPKLEALLRWHNEALGFISPDVFIPIAEASGLINKITLLVLQRVIADIKQWRSENVQICVAINLSADDVKNESLLDEVEKIVILENLPKDCVSFEITEGELVDKGSDAIEVLNKFKDKGFLLSIDDFGTGYSSLAYLKSMPVSEIKIDKSFVLNLENDQDDQNIVKAIISLAKNFNFKTVAEGVESKAALSLLQQWECDWIQGYYISKPMPSALVVDWVKNFSLEQYIR